MPTDPGWGRPRKAWSQLSPRGRAAWSARGAPYGLSGRRAYDWARARPSTRRRYEAYGRRFGLTDLEVYREPELVRAERRKRRPGDVPVPMLAFPWRYGQDDLYDNAEALQRGATTRWGLLILERQDPPAQRRWAFVEPDSVPFLAGEGPWHFSGTFRDLTDVLDWQEDSQIDWTVLVYVHQRGAFVWSQWWPFTSPSGTPRHQRKGSDVTDDNGKEQE